MTSIMFTDMRQRLFAEADETLMALDSAMVDMGLDEATREADLITFLTENFSHKFIIRFSAFMGTMSERQAERICREASYKLDGPSLTARASIAEIIMSRPVNTTIRREA